jgi:hypothetical protein
VQALPSLHVAPFFLAGFEHVPVPELHVPALWHWSLAVQVIELLPVQTPDWHVSVCVHALPSSHWVPFVLAGFEHVPLVLHAPTVWHWSVAGQVTAPLTQMPAWHVSFAVHAFPSSQLVPSALKLHAVVLVAGVHCWHALLGFTAPAA